jgi:hypothetical protein
MLVAGYVKGGASQFLRTDVYNIANVFDADTRMEESTDVRRALLPSTGRRWPKAG